MSPLSELERFIHRRWRQAEYPILLVNGELPSPITKAEEREQTPEKMAINEIRVRDVTIPQSTNMTSCIQKPEAGGRFDMKQSMVQILHSNGKFTNLSHEDPTVHIQNFLEISDTYTQTTLKLEQIKIM